MGYRKIRADQIFDGYKFLPGKVLVITEDGTIESLLPPAEAGEDVEQVKGILSPGLINCHCHLELSHMKGRIPQKTGLVDFVYKVVTERQHAEEEIFTAIERAEDEMLQSGIVAVGDICNNTLTIPQKSKSRLRYYNFIEASGWAPAVAQTRFERSQSILQEFTRLPFATAMVPHAPYSVSPELWEKIRPFFGQKVVSIHNQEAACEDEFFLSATGDFLRMYQRMKIDNSHHRPTGFSSLRSYLHRLQGATNAILVHNTFTKKPDLDFVFSTEQLPLLFFCLCINANLYIENRVPDIGLFRSSGCQLVLGTDSLASNYGLSILEEIKSIRKHFPQIPLAEILQWATSNGARALQMDQQLGSFEKGKKPGVVLIDENTLAVKRLC